MARWKNVRLPIHHNWTFFRWLLPLRRYKAKRVKTRCYQERVGHLEPRVQGGGVVPGNFFLVFTKLDTFCYLTVQTASCYVQWFWHNTGVWRMDGQTERRRRMELPLAMRRAVKIVQLLYPLQTVINHTKLTLTFLILNLTLLTFYLHFS